MMMLLLPLAASARSAADQGGCPRVNYLHTYLDTWTSALSLLDAKCLRGSTTVLVVRTTIDNGKRGNLGIQTSSGPSIQYIVVVSSQCRGSRTKLLRIAAPSYAV